jgi:hypothetical protein
MEPHVNNVCRVGFFYLKNISRQRKYLNKPTSRMSINAFVFSRLHYYGSLFYSVNQNLERKLQRLINYSGRVVGLLKHSDYVASLIKNEGWFSIRQLIHKNIAMLVHSCLYRCQLQLLRSLLKFEGSLSRSQITTRRVNDSTLLIRPATKIGDQAFCVASSVVWNALPLSITLSVSTCFFNKIEAVPSWLKRIFL